MEKKELFKEFVRKNPRLLKHVKSGDMNWQKFYEMYDLYGEDENTWNSYLKEDVKVAAATTAAFGLSDALNWVKGLDLTSVQNGVNSVQKVLGLLGDFSKKDNEVPKEEYKPRPLYKHFED